MGITDKMERLFRCLPVMLTGLAFVIFIIQMAAPVMQHIFAVRERWTFYDTLTLLMIIPSSAFSGAVLLALAALVHNSNERSVAGDGS